MSHQRFQDTRRSTPAEPDSPQNNMPPDNDPIIRQRVVLVLSALIGAVLLVAFAVLLVRTLRVPNPAKPHARPPVSGAPATSDTSGALRTDGWAPPADPDAWSLLVISHKKPMADGFEPDMVPVTSAGHLFDERAADALRDMVTACNDNDGHNLLIYSCYRGPTAQNQLYDDWVHYYEDQGLSGEETEIAARQEEPPFGQSDHQTGLAVDFTVDRNAGATDEFAATAEYMWLLGHAQEYGFILRFPDDKTELTGTSFQPYHFRYVGVEHATTIMNSGLALEEYVG